MKADKQTIGISMLATGFGVLWLYDTGRWQNLRAAFTAPVGSPLLGPAPPGNGATATTNQGAGGGMGELHNYERIPQPGSTPGPTTPQRAPGIGGWFGWVTPSVPYSSSSPGAYTPGIAPGNIFSQLQTSSQQYAQSLYQSLFQPSIPAQSTPPIIARPQKGYNDPYTYQGTV